jgi:Cysteine rich repeat
MKFGRIFLMGIFFVVSLVPAVNADQDMARAVAKNCKVELATYCKDVTPGGGRILACLHAYSDKLSDTCKEAVLGATGQIKALAAALSFVKDECAADLQQFCKDVPPGEGRLMNCLDANDAKLSGKCRAALKDVGLRE